MVHLTFCIQMVRLPSPKNSNPAMGELWLAAGGTRRRWVSCGRRDERRWVSCAGEPRNELRPAIRTIWAVAIGTIWAAALGTWSCGCAAADGRDPPMDLRTSGGDGPREEQRGGGRPSERAARRRTAVVPRRPTG